MAQRSGEKFGWIGGWLGGFIWVVILSIIFLVQGRAINGVIGLALFCVAVVTILAAAPWRHPDTRYWKLLIPVYVVFFTAIAWMVWSSLDLDSLGLNWWNSFVILPILLPFWTAGRRRWSDSDA
jgi:hypothetical protein